MAKTLLEVIKELEQTVHRIDKSENNADRANSIRIVYEQLAKVRFELIRDFDEMQDISSVEFSLNEVNASVKDDIIILEFDEALPCQKIDDAYTSRLHWREMMNSALKKLFDKYDDLPYFQTAFVCVEVHKTSKNWDISNRMLNLVINMLKGNFMPDDSIENLILCSKGRCSNCEKTIIYIGDYYTRKEEILTLWG